MDDGIAIRAMMNLCLSFDHRIVDGLTAGRFLERVVQNMHSYPTYEYPAVRARSQFLVVVTSVNRDDQPDGGSLIFAATIRKIRAYVPGCTVEVLTPDFEGVRSSLENVLRARPDVFNHNVETVERLTKAVRRRARYRRSLEVLRMAKEIVPGLCTKSGIMVGLGEMRAEITQTMQDLRACDVDILTIGQYLRPTPQHLDIVRYYHPDEFAELKAEGLALGFKHVESGPLVRSSYHAHEHAAIANGRLP